MVLKPTLRSSKHTTRKQFPRSVFVPWCFYVAEGHAFDTCPNLWWHVAFKVLRNGLLRYKLNTCPNLWWHSCSKYVAIDSFGTYLTHAQTCDDVRVKARIRNGLHRYILHTCPKLWCNRVESATEWTASVHTSHMSKAVMTFVLEVRCNWQLRYILDTCPNLWWRSCQSPYTEWTPSVHTSHMSKAVM